MNKTAAQTVKLRNIILFSPHVLEAVLIKPGTIKCRFGLIDQNMEIEVDHDGIARLVTKDGASLLNLALGPIEDCRSIVKSLDYFLNGLCEPHFLVG